MALGPGKYDDLCTYVCEQAGIVETGGAAIVIVIGGNRGPGFACQGDLQTMARMVPILEDVLDQLRADMEKLH